MSGNKWQMKWTELKAAQSCPTLWDPMDGILQARILEWVAFPFSRESSQPRDWSQVSRIAGGFSTRCVTREANDKWCRFQTQNAGFRLEGKIELLEHGHQKLDGKEGSRNEILKRMIEFRCLDNLKRRCDSYFLGWGELKRILGVKKKKGFRGLHQMIKYFSKAFLELLLFGISLCRHHQI